MLTVHLISVSLMRCKDVGKNIVGEGVGNNISYWTRLKLSNTVRMSENEWNLRDLVGQDVDGTCPNGRKDYPIDRWIF